MRNLGVLTVVILSLGAERAEASCATSGSATAYGGYWLERSGANCDCVFKARTYSCVATGGYRTESATVTLATVSGDCSTACEDLSGYATGAATARGYYVPGSGYGCDSTFTDADKDGFGVCIDADETRPRVHAKTSGIAERLCDGVDNDSDGSVDEGFGSACAPDRKRAAAVGNRQGAGADEADVVDQAYHRTEVDAVLAGPYGPLVFRRMYDSQRHRDDASLGYGWTHAFAVYLTAMPSGDDRYEVQTASGETEYFRCDAGTSDRSCVIDDHRPAGKLRKISGTWYYYPGDGTRYEFRALGSGRVAYLEHLDSAGLRLSLTSTNSSGQITKIETDDSDTYFSLSYDSNGLTAIRLSSTSGSQILAYEISAQTGWKRLDKVKFASSVGSIDANTYLAYAYTSQKNLSTVSASLDGSTTITLASMTYASSHDHVTRVKNAQIDLSMARVTGAYTQVWYNVESSGSPDNLFFHDGHWVFGRNRDWASGGIAPKTQLRDDHGRVTCLEYPDSRMVKLSYGSGWMPERTDYYGKTGDCNSGGSVERKVWHSYEYNSSRQSWRPVWTREKSVYSPAPDCSGASLPSGCSETKLEYVSSSDDRVEWVTETGYTRSTAGTVSQAVRKRRTYYFGLDTGTCASSGDWYTGLVCQTETQDGSSNVFERTAYTYSASLGLPKSVSSYVSGSTSLTTTFGSWNKFGTPTVVTSPGGMVTSYELNGWDAPTKIEEVGAQLESDEDTTTTITTLFEYNNLRALSRVTLPKGHYEDTIYYTGTGTAGFARVKARARLDTGLSKREIMRFIYDRFGNVIEDRVLDAMSGGPCSDEECTTYDVRSERKFNANRQVVEAYLHAADTSSPPDATQSYTYTNERLTAVTDYRGTVSSISYDSQSRVSLRTEDSGTGGLAAQTQLSYDVHGRTATVTAPAGVVTFYEHDDFGQLVIERSKTRGDMRFDHDAAGRATKRRRTSYKSLSDPEDTCTSYDWQGRPTAVDYGCNSSDNWTFTYDADGTGACPNDSVQAGHLTKLASSDFTRVMCYHPNGRLYASYQLESSTWSNSTARGTERLFDADGNVVKEYVNAHPSSRSDARVVEHVYDDEQPDHLSYVRHKLEGAESWTYVTSSSDGEEPTYYAFGGVKKLYYANGIAETTTRDYARRLTRRQTKDASTTFTDIFLTYDVNGNVTQYEDQGLRHQVYYAAMDKLDRLRCLSRASISSCTGTKPWESKFNESFDYDLSGNRTNRRFGAYASADDDVYSYVSGPTDLIDKVTSSGSTKEMSNDFKGGITSVSQPSAIDFVYDAEGRVSSTNDSSLGSVAHSSSYFGDRYLKQSLCNERKTRYYYEPSEEVGASPYVNLIDAFGSCADEYPRELRWYVYLEGRPLAVVHSTQSSGGTHTEDGTYWIHTDQLGTPVLVTNSSKVERWRWENDPFGRERPVEYTVSSADVSPVDDSSPDASSYNTCCCGGGGCGTGTGGCSSGNCTGGSSQAVVWTKTYSPGSATSVRLHFSVFDVKAGASRTGKDYLVYSDGSVATATLTGDLGEFWGPWTGTGTAKVSLVSDHEGSNPEGATVDKLEYTTATNGKFVMHLRFPGQVWDSDAKHAYNYARWYRAADGRYVSPDPIGLEGGEAGYFGYAGANPSGHADADGRAFQVRGQSTIARSDCARSPLGCFHEPPPKQDRVRRCLVTCTDANSFPSRSCRFYVSVVEPNPALWRLLHRGRAFDHCDSRILTRAFLAAGQFMGGIEVGPRMPDMNPSSCSFDLAIDGWSSSNVSCFCDPESASFCSEIPRGDPD